MELEFELNGVLQKHRIDQPQFQVGRVPGNDLQIPEPSVSSRHAKLVDGPAGAFVEDLGSTNGTRLNGEVVKQAPFKAGDDIWFGRVRVKVISTATSSIQAAPMPEVYDRTARFTAPLKPGAAPAPPMAPPAGEAPAGLALPVDSDLAGADPATGAAAIPAARLAALLPIAAKFASSRRPQELLDRLIDAVLVELKAELCAVYLADETGQVSRAQFRAPEGRPMPHPDPSSSQAVLGMVGQLMNEGKAVAAGRTPTGLRSVHAPMIAGGRRLGVVSAWCAGPVTEADLRVMGLIANEAAASLETDRFIEKLKKTYEGLVKEQESLVAECDQLEQRLAAAQAAAAAAGAAPQFEPAQPTAGEETVVGEESQATVNAKVTVVKQMAELAKLLDSLVEDMRGPLPALQAIVEQTLNEIAGGSQHRRLTIVLTPAHLALGDLQMIATHLAELSELQSGRVALEPDAIDVQEIVGEVHHYEGMAAQAKGVAFMLEAPESEVYVHADPRRLVQMLHHLVTVAVRLSPRGGEVKLALVPEGEGWVRFAVSDPGPPDAHGGPGIVIARRLARLHGTELELDDLESGGTEVSFVMPMTEPPAAE